MKNFKEFLTIIFLIAFSSYSFAQKSDKLLTDSEKINTIESIEKIINENYIFPEISEQIIILLNSKLKDGKYNAIKDPFEFAKILTTDVQSFNNDKHLRVLFEPKKIEEKDLVVSIEDSIKSEQDYIASLKKNNYFFKEVKILEGNIGYLDFRRFRHPEYAAETAISAMQFLSSTDAIIIDLRNNGGGSPKMVQFISSYFFNSDGVHLNSIYKRNDNFTEQYWTLPYVPGKRLPNVPLYILTSNRTFSAAEEFSYNLQILDRAIIIGETTGGGANPGGRIRATNKYNVWTPTARSINPISGTNWEGVGVVPDINISANEALNKAHIKALDSLKRIYTDETSQEYYSWYLQTVKTKRNSANIALSTLKSYVGNYGLRIISLEHDNLYYQRQNSMKYKLIPMTNDTFIIEELPDFRIQFVLKNNKVVAIRGFNENGNSSEYKINKH
ncbi:S41 family peptidase [Aequorivita viscosa]|nr:S41 family peptidase [Aequorivita viscosa]